MAHILFGWTGQSEPLWYCITKLSTKHCWPSDWPASCARGRHTLTALLAGALTQSNLGRVGKGAGTALLRLRDLRTPCPPSALMRDASPMVGTAYARLSLDEM